MSNRDEKLNRFLLETYRQVVADVPQERIGERAPGNGHPPVWVLGHLAICAELGLSNFGVELEHPEWVATFGPGSSDEISNASDYTASVFSDVILQKYPRLAAECIAAADEFMDVPHGLQLLNGSAIETRGDLLSHLLTSHFGMHLAQLSHWRRAAGHGPLF